MSLPIRPATPADADSCAAVYRPYVLDTAVTFELEPPSGAEFARRIAAAQEHHAWLVAERDGGVGGYAYAAPYKPRAAYRFTCEVSVYLQLGWRRGGAGRALYDALLARLEVLGYRQAVAGMTLPNEASVGLHRAMGFEPVGTLPSVGWKLGRWHDVGLMRRALGSGDAGEPGELRQPG